MYAQFCFRWFINLFLTFWWVQSSSVQSTSVQWLVTPAIIALLQPIRSSHVFYNFSAIHPSTVVPVVDTVKVPRCYKHCKNWMSVWEVETYSQCHPVLGMASYSWLERTCQALLVCYTKPGWHFTVSFWSYVWCHRASWLRKAVLFSSPVWGLAYLLVLHSMVF